MCVNFPDLLIIKGEYQSSRLSVLRRGAEVSGTSVKSGPGVSASGLVTGSWP